MTVQLPLLIASCPGRSVAEIRAEVNRCARAGADVGEVRIDRLTPAERSRLSDLFPSPIPLMATLRSRSEGGEGPDSSAERAALLDSAAQLPFRFVDLERARDGRLLSAAPLSEGDPTIVVSSHLSPSTASSEVRRLLELPRPSGAIVKVVVPCSFDRLWSDLIPGLAPFEVYAPYVLHTTGATGPLLRAWALRLGMFAAYASLPSSDGSPRAESVEPSQIPVDRLRAYVQGGPASPLFAVIGHPIQHSRSPDIHSFWMNQERRSGLYLAFDMATARELADSLAPLETGGFKGLNVTHPWKEVAVGLATQASPACEAAACANTLSFAPGTISAENTDVAAVRRRLSELQGQGLWDASPVIVLGGGGAARSALAAAASLGCYGIVVARRPEVAEALAHEYGGRVGRGALLQPGRLVIHATPAGREEMPSLDLPWADVIDSSTHIVDFVYEPTHPFLREGAIARGATYEDGSRLLVYQAAESYALWWGSAPSRELQESALTEVLCAG